MSLSMNKKPSLTFMTKDSHPEHLPQVRVPEAERDVGDMEAFWLRFICPLLVAAASCPPGR